MAGGIIEKGPNVSWSWDCFAEEAEERLCPELQGFLPLGIFSVQLAK